ncbi:MAG: phytoene desaturase [Flavobacteriales bacterium]|nr:phytoene desaturase [Flavobacteriales bacterium]
MKSGTIVIGAGFAGLSVAAYLARAGRKVTLLEKHDQAGGRARTFSAKGFTFDMGPSWYWMPDVFEKHFAHFDTHPSEHYDLVRLDPSYSVYFGAGDRMHVPSSMDGLRSMFESMEPGSSKALDTFLSEARFKYETGMHDMVRKPGISLTEFADMRIVKGLMRMQLFTSFSKHVRKYFKHPRLIKLMEFPVLFLGATPQETPALYSLMNHADMALGTWYPMGGMGKVVDAMVQVAQKEGVEIRYNETVKNIEVAGGKAVRVHTDKGMYECKEVIGGADYHHVEQHLLNAPDRRYTEQYWDQRTLAPSVLMFYLGINKKLSGLDHHTLFFDEDLDVHAKEIYTDPSWPTKPLFYASCSSITDPSVAPEGMENLVILIPIAPGLKDDDPTRERYYDLVMGRLESLTGQGVREHVIFKRSYSVNDLVNDMNAYKGNAYGLANTLKQTAILRPSIRSKKVKNLYYTGQLTVPGPGVPPALISGEVVARHILNSDPR